MEDISRYLYLWNGVATLTGTVHADTDWVYVNATLAISSNMYDYRNTATINPANGMQFPGQIAIPYAITDHGVAGNPFIFCRLPNPPYGAQLIDEYDPDAPNAMTELDPSNVGVYSDPDFGFDGKYLQYQVRSDWIKRLSGYSVSLPRPANNEVDFPPPVTTTYKDVLPNAILRQYSYDQKFTSYALDLSAGYPNWVDHEPVPIKVGPHDTDQRIISRGRWTYLGFYGSPAPGMVMDFNMQWWNGEGAKCTHWNSVSWT